MANTTLSERAKVLRDRAADLKGKSAFQLMQSPGAAFDLMDEIGQFLADLAARLDHLTHYIDEDGAHLDEVQPYDGGPDHG